MVAIFARFEKRPFFFAVAFAAIPYVGLRLYLSGMTKVWLIAGCSTGMGREFARAALEAGHCVVATARKPSSLDDLVTDFPDTAIALELDVTRAWILRAPWEGRSRVIPSAPPRRFFFPPEAIPGASGG